MRDRIFYLISIVVIAAIIGIALLPGMNGKPGSADPIENGYILQGEEFLTVVNAEGTMSRLQTGTGTDKPFLQLWTNVPRRTAVPSAGVFGTLGPDFEAAFGGKTLEVSVKARQSREQPLEKFLMGYFVAELNNRDSGWRGFRLSKDYRVHSFTYKPKARKSAPGNDYVGIWPGDDGDSRKMDIEWIKVKIIDTPEG